MTVTVGSTTAPPAATAHLDLSPGWRAIEVVVAGAALLLVGSRFTIVTGVTAGYAVAFALLPVWWSAARGFRGARRFLLLGGFAVLWGLLLAWLPGLDHRVDEHILRGSTGLLAGTLASVGVVLWARRLLPVRVVAVLFGLGMLLSAVTGPGLESANPWKFAWAIPVAVITLGLAQSRRSLVPGFVVLVVLGVVSAAFDSRSYFGTFMLSAAFVLWQLRPRREIRPAAWTITAVTLAGAALIAYNLGTTLLTQGLLGQAAQQRSVQQIAQSGSLILGSRPELAASIALMKHRPMGFGAGVAPSSADLSAAKDGLATVGYDPNNGYVERYMLGGHVELHSIVGDVWASWGIPGLVLALLVGGLVVRNLAELIARREADGLRAFLLYWTLWNLLFSPFFSAAPSLVLAVGLSLPPFGRPAAPSSGHG